MFAFIFKLAIAVVLIFVARYLSRIIKPRETNTEGIKERDGEGEVKPTSRRRASISDDGDSAMVNIGLGSLKIIRTVVQVLAVIFMVWAIGGTSTVWVTPGHIATFKRTYFGTSLKPGQIVALDGQLGPQAQVMTAGFHFDAFVTLINEVGETPVITIPPGKCAIMSAKDGMTISNASAFAEPWPEATRHKMVNDAVYFLTQGKDGGNGQRGPQTTVIGPGSYTINPFLWEPPNIIDATRVEQGTVGVVKSSIAADVDFGSFKRAKPTSNALKILTADKIPNDSVRTLIFPVGAVGVWEEALPPNLYYINTDAYRITMVPTTAQVYEYKGGYTKRTVEIWLNDAGQIEEKKTETVVQVVPTAAAEAIFTKPEGWDVPQEIRVLAQVSPEMAPFVVASLGLTQANASEVIRDRVVTPTIRSVVRDVLGGKQVPFVQTKAVLGVDGKPELTTTGETKTELVHDFRPVKVLDLLENRSSIEDAIKIAARIETQKEGVMLNETRLQESAIPPELLLARKREQLAQQLKSALIQEQLTQAQRKLTENSRAEASQQETLVRANIAAQAAMQNKAARTTEGEGEKAYLIAIAEGQKAQTAVLGQDITSKLQMFQQTLKAIEGIAKDHPEILTKGLENASKFVPNVVVSNSGAGSNSSNGSMEGAAAIFAQLMSGGFQTPAKAVPAVATK